MTDNELKLEIERAATGLLSDKEILDSLNITQEQLNQHYSSVIAIRIKIKQKLNSKRIASNATNADIETLIKQIPRNNPPPSKSGGARPGAGRKPGSTNKISAASLLKAIEEKTGDKFENLLALGYQEAIEARDGVLRLQYEKLILSKVVADKTENDGPELSNEEIQKRIDELLAKEKGASDANQDTI